jgi:16S rRNA (adenine1518-N6/adenine1519-N6)-dimethyltransferase
VALLAEVGRHPSRSLGQNFVVDPNTVLRIARLAGVGAGDHVVEVGAGFGSLTLALAATGAAVLAIEIDSYLVPLLRRGVEPAGVEVVEGDALTVDWPLLLRSHQTGPLVDTPSSPSPSPGSLDMQEGRSLPAEPSPSAPDWVLVANLPYNVATPLVVTILEEVPQIVRMLVMVQREVGERLTAGPGTRSRGAVSVKVEWFAEASIAGSISREVFLPRPNVDSVLVAIDRRPRPAVDPVEVPYQELMALVRAGFARRRKMLRGALAGLVSPEAFAAAGVDPAARAEMLGIDAWGRLARCQKSLVRSPAPN